MLTTYQQAYKTMVYAEMAEGRDKLPVGIFLDFVINPDDGTAAGLWVQTLHGKRILNPHDILHWRSSEILISEADDCYDPDSNQKLKRLFTKECTILGAKVYSWPAKKRLGQVRDFGFDTISPRILSLHVRPRWWQFWQKRIFPHQRIYKITPQGIFINDQAMITTDPTEKPIKEGLKPEAPKADCED